MEKKVEVKPRGKVSKKPERSEEKGREPVDIKQVAAAGTVRTTAADPPPGAVAEDPTQPPPPGDSRGAK